MNKKTFSLSIVFLQLLLITLIFYADSYSHFFFQDDWWHFYISQASTFKDFLAFFNPQNVFGYQIYRPLSTQVFFFLFQSLFGYNHTIFQTIVLLLLSINSYLIYSLSSRFTKPTWAFLLALFYMVHHQNIGMVYYLSTIQTALAVLFILLAYQALTIKSKYWQLKTLLYFGAALLCHEIVILASFIFSLLLLTGSEKKRSGSKFLITGLGLMTAGFIVWRYRFLDYSFFGNTHYELSLSPKTFLNSLMWYLFWFMSVPEYVINFVGSGFRPLPPLFGVFKTQTFISLIVLVLNATAYVWLAIKTKFSKVAVIYKLYFLLSLLPVLFFPWHKYTYYLPFASIWLILALGLLFRQLPSQSRLPGYLLSILIISSIVTNFIDRSTSSSYQRGQMSANIKSHLDLSAISTGPKVIYLANDPAFSVFAAEWGSTSSQAKVVLRDDLYLKLVTGNPELTVVYQDDLKQATPPIADYTFMIDKNW